MSKNKKEITVEDIKSAMKDLGIKELYPKKHIVKGGVLWEVSEGVFTGQSGVENFHERLLEECGIKIVKKDKP